MCDYFGSGQPGTNTQPSYNTHPSGKLYCFKKGTHEFQVLDYHFKFTSRKSGCELIFLKTWG